MKTMIGFAIAACLFAGTQASHAACEPPDYEQSTQHKSSQTGDDYYTLVRIFNVYSSDSETSIWAINDILKYLADFGINQSSWETAYGKADWNALNTNARLTRLLNAIDALRYSAPVGHNSKMPLVWAYDFVNERIDTTTPECGTSAYADYPGGAKKEIRLFETFFEWQASARAGILVHESRHYDKGHSTNPTCNADSSCDPSWAYNGANTYHVNFLADFTASGTNTTPWMRYAAWSMANFILNSFYDEDPGFRVELPQDVYDAVVGPVDPNPG